MIPFFNSFRIIFMIYMSPLTYRLLQNPSNYIQSLSDAITELAPNAASGMAVHDDCKLRFLDLKAKRTFRFTLESDTFFVTPLRGSVGLMPSQNHTAIELAGMDRPALLSEVCAFLTDLHCNVVNAVIWMHNARAAAVFHVTDDSIGCAIEDPKQLLTIKELLRNVLKGSSDLKTTKMTLSPPGVTRRERRLRQIVFADRDYEITASSRDGKNDEKSSRPRVNIGNCIEKDYTVITMKSKDRPKLLFDTLCTVTDMQYVIFHGVVHTGRLEAYQTNRKKYCLSFEALLSYINNFDHKIFDKI
ncbi:hypothetical protein DCAR_0205281 [Daucus carota subsp. sativus]|uniref:ACT domain-containing protein ACR n=1 Tax=Daucus carota subsp. sativus TaxID=79200 RepID=A0AAF1AKL1_DAUCS|nr:hypothetical protein DCAR_0205281 [Daucus carota subsp. sativus]